MGMLLFLALQISIYYFGQIQNGALVNVELISPPASLHVSGGSSGMQTRGVGVLRGTGGDFLNSSFVRSKPLHSIKYWAIQPSNPASSWP